MALDGKDVVVKYSTDGTVFNDFTELNNCSLGSGAENIDVTEFGDDWRSRIQGLKDATWSLSGFYDPSNAAHQAVRDAYRNDTALHLQVLVDGTNGFQQEVKVSSFEVSASVDGAVEMSVEAEGTGEVTIVGS